MSIFSESLKRLLDESRYFEIHEWTKFLGTVSKRIDDWCHDKSIPRPYELSMIHLLMEERQHDGIEALEAFNKMCDQRATEVSPFGNQMLPTVRHYMKRPIFCELSSKLNKMNAEERGKYLESVFLDYSGIIGQKVIKKSNRPFKSTLKANTVKSVIDHPVLFIPAYTFVEDDSVVECRQCVLQSKEDE